MAIKIIFLQEFGKAFVPKRFTPSLRKYFLKAGYSSVPYKLFGALFYATALITGILYSLFIYPAVAAWPFYLTLFASMFGWFSIQLFLISFFAACLYFFLDVQIFRRTKKMEELLPDFLQVLSSNLKGGMSFENALFGSIKPRFSVLAKEMSEVSKKVMTGYDISTALEEFGQKYNSPMLARTIDLMVSEIESGGHITSLIDNIVDSLKETKVLKDEISASVITYTIFIGAIVIVISPLLFALSFHLLIIILGFVGKLSSVASISEASPLSISETVINPLVFRNFSIGAIIIISFFSSLIVSTIEKGNIRAGLKYIPIFVIGSIAMYFVFMNILLLLFQGLRF